MNDIVAIELIINITITLFGFVGTSLHIIVTISVGIAHIITAAFAARCCRDLRFHGTKEGPQLLQLRTDMSLLL